MQILVAKFAQIEMNFHLQYLKHNEIVDVNWKS